MFKIKSQSAAVLIILTFIVSGCTMNGTTNEVATAPAAPAITLVDGKYIMPEEMASFSDFILVETQLGKVSPRIVDMGSMVDDLAQYDVVFVGEAHGHAASHYVQSKVFSGLYKHDNNIALSMEQFERDVQPIVDQYLAGEIGEETLVFEGRAWPHYRSSYRPMVEFARRNGLAVIASEVPTNMVGCVGDEGPAFIERLTGEQKTWIAKELNTQDGPYKDRYFSFLKRAAGHSVDGADMTEEEKAEKRFRRFSAQVSRDDTMAESIDDHIRANPGRKVMHTNGSFHSAAMLGTVERLKMRNPDLKLANIHPIMIDDPKNPSFDASLVGEGQYLLLIYPIPKRFVKMSNINAFIKRTKDKIDDRNCKY